MKKGNSIGQTQIHDDPNSNAVRSSASLEERKGVLSFEQRVAQRPLKPPTKQKPPLRLKHGL